jgi:hypothetical protein
LWWPWRHAGSLRSDSEAAGAGGAELSDKNNNNASAGVGTAAGAGAFALVRLKALRSTTSNQSFSRSAQDAATECNESVANIMAAERQAAEDGINNNDDNDDDDDDVDVEPAPVAVAAVGAVRSSGRNTPSAF